MGIGGIDTDTIQHNGLRILAKTPPFQGKKFENQRILKIKEF